MTQLAKRMVGSRPFQHAIIAIILLAGVLAGVETNRELVEQHRPLLRTLDVLV